MSVGRGLQILGGLLAFGAASSMLTGAYDGPSYYGNIVGFVIGAALFAWGGKLHGKRKP